MPHPLITQHKWDTVETNRQIIITPFIGESLQWVINQAKRISNDTGKTVIVKGNQEDIRVEEKRKRTHEPTPVNGWYKKTPNEFDLIELD